MVVHFKAFRGGWTTFTLTADVHAHATPRMERQGSGEITDSSRRVTTDMTHADGKLFEALSTLGERIVTVYAEHANAGRMQWHGALRLEFSEDGNSLSLAHDAAPYPRGMLGEQAVRTLLAEPSVQSAMKVLWELGYFAPVEMSYLSGEPITPTAENTVEHNFGIFLQLVSDYFAEEKPRQISGEATAAFLVKRRERWASKTVTWEASVPLLHFTATIPRLELGNGVRLERLDAATKSAMWHPLRDGLGRLTADELRYAGARIVMSAELPREQHTKTGGDVGPRAWCAITALRLLKPGPVGAAVMIDRELLPYEGQSGQSELPEFYLPAITFGRYVLTDSEVEPFRGLCDKLSSLLATPRFKPLSLCLRRFNLSYSRDQLEDRIIDLVIALEGSLLFGDNQELRYKTAFRGAAILATTHDPVETALALKRLYDVRSKIVHDGVTLADVAAHKEYGWLKGEHLETYVNATESLTRAILAQYVERVHAGVTVSTVNTALDDAVANGLRRT